MKHSCDLLILFCPFWTPTLAPMGPALLKAYIEKEGFSCFTLDLNVELYNAASPEYREYWEMKNGFYYPEDKLSVVKYYNSIEALRTYYISKIVALNPKRVGASLYTATRLFSELFLEELKHFLPDTEFLIGGPHIAPYENNVDYYLSKPYIDVLVQGEGEIALLEYLQKADNKKYHEPIGNVTYKRGSKVIKGDYISNSIDLNSIPVPDYSDYDLESYNNKSGLNIFASRGCPNKCVFCSERNYFSNFKIRKAETIFNDIKVLKNKYPHVRDFNLADSISNASTREIEKLCDLIIESGLDINIIMQNAVIRKEMRAPLYKKLKAAGCSTIGYGMESPDSRLLENIGKTLSRNVDIGAVIKEGTDAGINISINIMFGLPGETEEDFNTLMDFLRDHKDDIWQINPAINFCALWPGSFGNMNPEKWDVELNDSPDYWEIKKDNNTYLTRLERFEKFTSLSKKMGLQNLFGTEEITNKDEMIGLYYFHKNDYEKALQYFNVIPKGDITLNVERAIAVINGENINSAEKYIPEYLKLKYDDSDISLALLTVNSDISVYVEGLKENVFNWRIPQTPWKAKVRKLGRATCGVKKYEHIFNNILTLCSYFQKENSSQAERLINLLVKNGFIEGEENKSILKNNSHLEKYSMSEMANHIDIIKDDIGSLKIYSRNVALKPYYEITKYRAMLDVMIEGLDLISELSMELKQLGKKIDDLEARSKAYDINNGLSNIRFDESYVLQADEMMSDFDKSIRRAIKNLLGEHGGKTGLTSKLTNLFQSIVDAGGLNEKLASIYRVLFIVNQQNKHKHKIVNLIEHSFIETSSPLGEVSEIKMSVTK